jgi:flagellin
MTLQISTNTAAARASYNLGRNNMMLQRSFDRLSSGKKLTSPIQDPGSLAVSMKLSAAVNRLAGAQNNSQNALSFLEVQDGMLETVGNIIDRMSELKGLASQDPMKSAQDRASYDNEFKDLQVQLYDIAMQKFNGVSLFARYATDDAGGTLATETRFNAQNASRSLDNTLTIYTSAEGSEGSKISVYKSQLLSALTVGQDKSINHAFGEAVNTLGTQKIGYTTDPLTFASASIGGTISLDQLSVNVINQALENIAFLRAQNGGVQSRLAFNLQSLAQQKTNLRAALGRSVDADIAEETTMLSKYQVLSQAAASMLTQANANTELALMLLR